MKTTIDKLYGFITKLVTMLEEELDEINHENSKKTRGLKKDITLTLNKLVTIIMQLNKVSKDECLYMEYSMPEEDQRIIEEFLEKYRKE
jgi:hypothetical protein